MRTNNQLYEHIMPAKSFYYDGLSFKEKSGYTKLLNAIRNRDKRVNIGGFSSKEVMAILTAVSFDNPDLYYFNFTSVQYMMGALGVEIDLKYYHLDKYQELVQKVDRLLDNVRKMPKQGNRLIKIVEIFYNFTYKNSGRNEEHTIFDPLMNGTGVCQGFSALFTMLCRIANIECISVIGTLSGGSHEWNIVELEGKLYTVDITNSISAYHNSNGAIKYAHICIPDYMYPNNKSELRFDCNHLDRNPYFTQGNYFEDEKSLLDALDRLKDPSREFTMVDISKKQTLDIEEIAQIAMKKKVYVSLMLERYVRFKS